jgi:hypothetical protein
MTDKTPAPEVWTHLHALHRFHSPAVPTPPPPFERPDGSFDSAAYLAWLNSK